MGVRWRLVATAALLLGATACSGDDDGVVEVDALTAVDAWAAPSPPGATNGLVYMTLISPVDSALRQVEVSSEVAAAGSLQPAMDHGDEVEASEMPPLREITLPAGREVVLAPDAEHIMLRNLVAPLEVGDTFDVLLVTEQADPLLVTITVSDGPPE